MRTVSLALSPSSSVTPCSSLFCAVFGLFLHRSSRLSFLRSLDSSSCAGFAFSGLLSLFLLCWTTSVSSVQLSRSGLALPTDQSCVAAFIDFLAFHSVIGIFSHLEDLCCDGPVVAPVVHAFRISSSNPCSVFFSFLYVSYPVSMASPAVAAV